MNGHLPLLAMRRAGYKPECVYVMDDDCDSSIQLAMDWHTEPNNITNTYFVHIRVLATDIPETLDFRCCIGLVVHLYCSRGYQRCRRLFKSLVAAQALKVMTVQNDLVFTHGVKNG